MPIDSLLKELRSNTRLRIGIGVIIAILLGYLILALRDQVTHLQQEHATVLERLNQLLTLAKQANWPERAVQAGQLRKQVESTLWQADTLGLAQATFQKWLDDKIKISRLEDVKLEVDATLAVPHQPQLWQVTARLKGDFAPDKFNRLLYALAKHPQLIVTDQLDILQAATPRFTLIVKAYFLAPTVTSGHDSINSTPSPFLIDVT